METNKLTEQIIGSAIEVHKLLGPGLLESAYEACLCYELAKRNLQFEQQVPLPIRYKDVNLDCGYRIDVIVEKTVIVEIKSVAALEPIHKAQVITYLKLGNWKIGLLINFNVLRLTDGLQRIVFGLDSADINAINRPPHSQHLPR